MPELIFQYSVLGVYNLVIYESEQNVLFFIAALETWGFEVVLWKDHRTELRGSTCVPDSVVFSGVPRVPLVFLKGFSRLSGASTRL